MNFANTGPSPPQTNKLCRNMSTFEIYLPESRVDETVGIEELASTLSNGELRPFAYFDELLTGYILLNKEENQQPINTTLDLYIQGLNGQLVNLKSISLNSPIKSKPTKVIYKFILFLSYPKIKLGDSQLHLKVQTTLNNKRISVESQQSNHTLANYYPADHRNILDGIKPTITTRQNRFLMSDAVLSDSLIKHNKLDNNNINTIDQSQFPAESPDLQISKELAIPTVRILNLRVRNIRIKKNSILSTIDVELSSKFKPLNTAITLNNINYRFQNTSQPKFKHAFPITISEDDSFSFTFQLDSNDILNFKTLIEIDYSFNNHNIKTKWITNIEFNAPQQALKRSSTASLPQSNPSSSLSSGLTIKFLGNKKVKIGEVFKLRAHIINNSKRNRNLVMVFNSGPEAFLPNIPKAKSLIQTNVNLLKFYSTSRIKTTGVLSLVNEVHFKVCSDQVSESEIYLVGLEVGVFNLSGVQLVDLTTGETMSCDKLLEVVVVE